MSLIDALQSLNLFGSSSQASALNSSTTLASGASSTGTQSMDSLLKNLTSDKVETIGQSEIDRVSSAAQSDRSIFAETSSGTSQGSFASTLTDFVDSVDAKSHAADQANTDILTGKSDNIHQAMISMQEASISFDLLVQVRNKLVDAYKELSRMTV
jgi:flagellar hook-basal body complex protein FliE